MGKGDRKTAKGKRFNSSYGNVRPHQLPGKAPVAVKTATAVRVAKPVAVKKAPVKKAAAKKA